MSSISPLIQQMRGPLEQTPQDAELQSRSGQVRSGKDVARAMRDSMTGQNSLEVAAGKDSVVISEEGRAMQQSMAAKAGETEKKKGPGEFADAGTNARVNASGGDGEGMSAAERSREAILKQIKQVKEKIEKAEERLAEAMANQSNTPSDTAEDAATQALAAMGGATDVEAIQAEIKMLQQQLQTLQQQLAQGGGGGAGTNEGKQRGTAGIGGAGTGEGGGMGERISVG